MKTRAAPEKNPFYIQQAHNAIAPKEDAVDIATDAKKALLLAWKKYRVLLNRLDISKAPDIEWPEVPG